MMLEALREGEGQHEQGGGEAADYAEEKFDPDEAIDEAAIQIAGEGAADAHGEEVGADDGGELEDAVAEEVAGEGAGDEFVDQAAGGDEEDGDEEEDAHSSG